LDRQTDCTLHLDHIISVQMDLLDALSTCTSSRQSLGRAKHQFVNCSLGILSGYRRKQQALAMVENLKIIQTLQKTENRLDTLLKQDKYPEAIKLLLECQSVANNYKHFTAIKQLTVKLQDTLVMTEENLDTALARVCTNFDNIMYSKIQEAYTLLGKTQTAMDQLLMHITSSIHTRSWSLVQVHAAMSSSCNPEELSRRPYPELCQTVCQQLFLPCLLDLIKVLWDIMLNYRKIHHWHQINSSELQLIEEQQSLQYNPPDVFVQGSDDKNSTRDSEEIIVVNDKADNDDRTDIVSEENVGKEKVYDETKEKETVENVVEIDNTRGVDSEERLKKLESRRSEVEEFELQLQKQYISKKLDSGLGRIWQEVQTKVRILVQSSNLAQFSIEQFIRFLDTIHILLQVGKEFCGHDSETLQVSLQQQCLSYFQNYHIARLDELKTHLENEGWTLCPVKISFSPRSLTEFGHMKLSAGSFSLRSPSKSPSKRSSISSTDTTAASGSYFTRYWADGSGNPFDDVLREVGQDEDILELDPTASEDGSSEEEEFGGGEAVEQKTGGPVPRQGFCLANTSLMVLRQFGRYIHLMKLLHPISNQILLGMKQLLEFYVYSVYKVLNNHQTTHSWISSTVNPDIANLFQNVEKEIILHCHLVPVEGEGDNNVSGGGGVAVSAGLNHTSPGPAGGKGVPVMKEEWRGLVRPPNFSDILPDLQNSKYAGLLESIVAVESCVYLINQLSSLSTNIKECLTSPDLIDGYFASHQDVGVSLRDCIYLSSINKLLNLEQVLASISKIKWDLKEVRSQHSDYVDTLIHLFQQFKVKLDHLAGAVPLDTQVRQHIWNLAFKSAAYLFVEGFCTAKKCTNEGRALMQLDYRQFVLKMEHLTDIRPIPHQDHVTTYIKAFYIPESELEMWVESHPEYSTTQLTALVNAVAYSNNKARQKLNNIVNDLQSKIRR